MVKLFAVGDIALSGDYSLLIEKEGPYFPFLSIASYLKKGNIVLGNLETPLSNLGHPDSSKAICLRGLPEGIDALASSGFTHVSIANNHSCDYGVEALRDTQEHLTKAGISWMGAGKDSAQSRQPVIQAFCGGTIAFLAYNSYVTNGRQYARRGREGIAPLEYSYIKADIQSLRESYSPLVIVVSLHWGIEGSHYPTPFQRYLAHRIIEDGADLILGHHAHVMQGIERYRKGVIVYNLGNFCFPDVASSQIKGLGVKQGPENKESFIFTCEIGPDSVEGYQPIPVYLNQNLQPCLASGQRRSDIMEQISSYSESFGNSDYERFYKNALQHKGGYGSRLVNLLNQEGLAGVTKRLRFCYFRAIAIGLLNSLREARHRRQVLQEVNNGRRQ